jgi:hypothetical protein
VVVWTGGNANVNEITFDIGHGFNKQRLSDRTQINFILKKKPMNNAAVSSFCLSTSFNSEERKL